MPSTDRQQRDYWKSHYDSMARHESLDLFQAEAADFFERLSAEFPLTGVKRALDFGCGLGFVSELLASKVANLSFYDHSANMLSTASVRLADRENARAVDLSDPRGDQAGAFDLILLNSVVQYMSEDELSDWLRRWRGMLTEDGTLIISDVILPQPAFFREVYDSLLFSAHHGFLFRTLVKDFMQYARYLRARKDAPMTRYSKERFSKLAGDAGFSVSVLPRNLTYRTNRFSALLVTVSD